MRDHWQDKVYFEGLVEECEILAEKNYSIEKLKKFESVSPEKKCNLINRSSGLLFNLVKVMYAKGSSFEELSESFGFSLKRLWEADSCYKFFRGTVVDNGELFVTPNIISTIVYAESLRFERIVVERFAECIPSGKDQLVDRLLSHYQPDREISQVVKEKGKYKQLIEILDSSDKAFQAKKLKTYLDQWPKKLGIRAPDGIRPLHETPTYDGYWCYEAAAVVIVADIDDESFKDHEFYPTELMSWRK